MKTFIATAALLALAFQAALGGDAPPIVRVRHFGFAVPVGWTLLASSAEGESRLTVGRGPATAQVTFSKYGMGGGSAEDDTKTWFNEFSGSGLKHNLESDQIGSVKIYYATTEGTFSSGEPGEKSKRTGYALLGAVLESKNGVVYVKMVGPAATVRGATQAFKTMVAGAAKTAATPPRKPKSN